jgi:HSP20 family molecular chaperone IbpA
MKHALELPGIQPASITVPAEALQPGKYMIVISGRTSDGTENEIARGSFELQFTDK